MEGKDWKLPFFVEWRTPGEGDNRIFGVLRPALSLYPNQLLTVQNLLGSYSLEDRNDRWVLPNGTVHSMLVKAQGITPQFYYHWPEDTRPPVPAPPQILTLDSKTPIPNRREERFRAFADYVSRTRGIPADTVLVVMTAVSQVGANWMLGAQQTLDLGFVKLTALPFRPNWKEIVAFKCKGNKLSTLLASADRKKLLSEIDFPEVVSSPHNVSLAGVLSGKLRRLHYTIEAVPTQQFENTADFMERARMLTGHSSYVAHYEQTVEKFYNEILASMDHYLWKTGAPWAEIRAVSTTGLMSFLPISRHRARMRGLSLDNIPKHIAAPDSDFTAIGKQSDPILVYAQAAQMRKMPAIQSQASDVRDSDEHRDVVELRPGGTVRMPVLDAGQSADSGQSVLPCDTSR